MVVPASASHNARDLDAALSIRGIRKHFGGVLAVDHCSLDLKRGAITGLIGPNGAGKTTLYNITAGLFQFERRDITPCRPTGDFAWVSCEPFRYRTSSSAWRCWRTS